MAHFLASATCRVQLHCGAACCQLLCHQHLADFWSATTQIEAEASDVVRRDRLEKGYWWELKGEPPPMRSGADLIATLEQSTDLDDAWDDLQRLVGGDLSSAVLHIGLRYPSRHDGSEWLFLALGQEQKEGPGGATLLESRLQQRARFEAGQLACLRTSRLNPDTLRFRNTGVVAGTVASKTVAFIGLGALGSQVAELLVKSGVGGIRLCDLGRLEVGNVCRHVGSVEQFGERKTTVLARRLLSVNPYLQFGEGDIVPASASGDLDRLEKFIGTADLVICTTADEGVESVVNEVAVRAGRQVLYGRALRRGSMGRVFLVRPGVDACKACLATSIALGRAGGEYPADLIDVVDDDDVLLHECGRPVIAGSGIDLSFVSTLIARIALDQLSGVQSEVNHWVWSRDGADDVDERLATPLSTFSGRVHPASACPICQEPEIRRIVLPPRIREQLEAETCSSPDAETGGVLIGRIDGHQAFVIRASGPGPNAVRSASIFRRDVEYTQAELDKAAEELGSDGLYIGEWHSHLVPKPIPSATDIESLVGIARAPHYLTRCPVMLICGLDTTNRSVEQICGWSIPIGGRVFPVPIADSADE